MNEGKKLALLALLVGTVAGCGADAGPEGGNIVTIVHARGPDGETSYFIDTKAYREHGEIVRVDEPGAEPGDADGIGRNEQEVVLATGYGGPADETQEFCGTGSGTWVRSCIVPRSKTIRWSWNTSWSDDYYLAFDSAQSMADTTTAWVMRPFVAGESPNVIFYSSTLASGAYAETITEAESTKGRVNGKVVYRFTTTPVEVHIDKNRIDPDLSGTYINKLRQRQHVLCHEIGHAMGLPHNPDGEGSLTCMQARGITTVRTYSSKEKTRLDIFTPGDWDNTTLITVQ